MIVADASELELSSCGSSICEYIYEYLVSV